MKILTATQVRLTDAHTIEHEPIASIDLMERASIRFVEAFCMLISNDLKVAIVCGTGNNGGDGLAVARLLKDRGYRVHPIIVQPNNNGSEDFLINLNKLDNSSNLTISSSEQVPGFHAYDVIIDAIFGSGLTREISGLYGKVIEGINKAKSKVVAIDIPSGLFMDELSPNGLIVKADYTISFQLPKLAFFLPENFEYVGEWQVVDIGLDKEFIKDQTSDYQSLDATDIKKLLPLRQKFDHKGSYGHAQIIGGSYGKIGAITLASAAVLRSGAGLVSAGVPECGVNIIQSSFPEAMVIRQDGVNHISKFNILESAKVIGLGPGIGTKEETAIATGNFLRLNNKELVIDADGLNILSQNAELIELLNPGTIITPHLKEFDRLLGESSSNLQRLSKARDFARKKEVIIILKGAHTAVIEPDGLISFNTTGNPGIATAGSGDVLLGIIAGLRAQGLSASSAAKLGVYLHGLAGDIAAEQLNGRSIIAGDLIDNLGEAFNRLEQ